MKTKTILICGLFLLGLTAACSSDDNDGNPTPDTGPTPDTTTPDPDKGTPDPDKGTPDPDKGMTDAMDDAMGDDAAAPTGACTNVDDGALLDTEEKRDGISAATSKCGTETCLAGLLSGCDAACMKCLTDCVTAATKLSEGCATCYINVVTCSAGNCMPACLTPDSKECTDCQTTNKCIVPTFYDCSGLPQP